MWVNSSACFKLFDEILMEFGTDGKSSVCGIQIDVFVGFLKYGSRIIHVAWDRTYERYQGMGCVRVM